MHGTKITQVMYFIILKYMYIVLFEFKLNESKSWYIDVHVPLEIHFIVRTTLLIKHYMSRRIRKPTICICENKGTDQLCSNCTADQRLCFHYPDSTIPHLLIPILKLLACFRDCTVRFVSDLVGNPNCWVSHA